MRATQSVLLDRVESNQHANTLQVEADLCGSTKHSVRMEISRYAEIWPPRISKSLVQTASKSVELREGKFGYPGIDVVQVNIELIHPTGLRRTSFFAHPMDHLPADSSLLIDLETAGTLGELGYHGDYQCSLFFPKVTDFMSSSIDSLKTNKILVLGGDTDDNIDTLRQVEVAVRSLGLGTWILKDFHDFAWQDLSEKLIMMASCSKGIIVEDSQMSGHLSEVAILSLFNSTPIAILRSEKFQSSWMLDPISDRKNCRFFNYDREKNPAAILNATYEAIAWIGSHIQNEGTRLDQRYPWRANEALMAQRAE